MDYFLSTQSQLSGPDSLSLQEMLDMDIKSENDFENVFTCGDFNLNFAELPALNLDEDSLGAPGDNNVWLTSSSDSQSLLGGDINSSLSLDMTSGETRMVSPNAVMPVTLIQVPYQGNEDSDELKDIKPKRMSLLEDRENRLGINILKTSGGLLGSKNINNNINKIKIKEEIKQEIDEENLVFNEEEYLAAGISFAEDSIKQEKPEFHIVSNSYTPTNKGKVRMTQSNITPHITKTSPLANRNNNTSHVTHSTKKHVNTVRTINSKKRLNDQYTSPDDLLMAYPKPAYSYSCLIAMALKNSPSGSLPVSEIYNFMCEHFPYFKTAPSGWKNSVRHNLSLNKCFEKIEKPATNGSQRKGCLWAMNPNKIGKMDEEVQKWSKKDKIGIKKSMVYPESLDALERGELSGNYNHNPGSIETIHSEMESEEEAVSSNDWEFKTEDVSEDEEEEEDEDDDQIDITQTTARLSAEQVTSVFSDNQEFEESDLSLSDFDIEVTESVYNDLDSEKLKQRLSPSTSPFQALSGVELSGGATYTFNPHSDSPKRIKTLGGSTISGNYVYKPIGTATSRRKSPLRPTLLSSLEVETDD